MALLVAAQAWDFIASVAADRAGHREPAATEEVLRGRGGSESESTGVAAEAGPAAPLVDLADAEQARFFGFAVGFGADDVDVRGPSRRPAHPRRPVRDGSVTDKPATGGAKGVLVVAGACAACCAGPLLAALGVLGVALYLVVGALAIAIVLPLGLLLWRRSRRRPVSRPVGMPTLRRAKTPPA